MGFGPKLVILGTISGAFFLALTLMTLTASLSYVSAASASGQMDKTISDEVVRRPVTCGISDLFPQEIRQWCDLITYHALQQGLAPDLVAALIWLESGGEPSAYSHSGAVGLMQVMPRDGLAAEFMCVNGPCFSNRPTIEELRDPNFNLAYGTKFLASLLQQRGSLREALKSYGPIDVGYGYADQIMALYSQYSR